MFLMLIWLFKHSTLVRMLWLKLGLVPLPSGDQIEEQFSRRAS
ncbi:hypothetical protein VPHK469_0172 [Vibrio phage K469]